MPTLTLKPSGHTGVSGLTANSSYPYTNGYNFSSNTTSSARLAGAKNATGLLYYTFDFSGLPSNIKINSITCSVRANANSTSTNYIREFTAQAYNSITGLVSGSSTSFLSTTVSEKSFSCGTFDKDSIRGLRLRLYFRAGNRGSTSYYGSFYGATLTIDYEEVTGTGLFVKDSGTWVETKEIYEKRQGSWIKIESSDLNLDQGTKLIRKY